MKDSGLVFMKVLFSRLEEDTMKDVLILYNSALSFSQRLYDLLDVGLSPIHLQEPLETILMKPLVYVRNMVPYSCLQAMLRYEL